MGDIFVPSGAGSKWVLLAAASGSAGIARQVKSRAMPLDILLVAVLRALAEVAGMMLLGRGLLWLFGPKARKGNFVYDLLTVGTVPFIKLARAISPRFVPDAHVPAIAFFLLFWIWVGLGIAKHSMCVARALQCV